MNMAILFAMRVVSHKTPSFLVASKSAIRLTEIRTVFQGPRLLSSDRYEKVDCQAASTASSKIAT